MNNVTIPYCVDAITLLISENIYLVVGFHQTAIWNMHQQTEALLKALEQMLAKGAQAPALQQARLEAGVIEVAGEVGHTIGAGHEKQGGR